MQTVRKNAIFCLDLSGAPVACVSDRSATPRYHNQLAATLRRLLVACRPQRDASATPSAICRILLLRHMFQLRE